MLYTHGSLLRREEDVEDERREEFIGRGGGEVEVQIRLGQQGCRGGKEREIERKVGTRESKRGKELREGKEEKTRKEK